MSEETKKVEETKDAAPQKAAPKKTAPQKSKKVKVKFVKSPSCAPFYLAYNVKDEVSLPAGQAAELIEVEFATKI